jgi:hypothetical protein
METARGAALPFVVVEGIVPIQVANFKLARSQ